MRTHLERIVKMSELPETQVLYPINDFYLTLQGEGAYSGTPIVLLRLHGCAVGCHFCDTKETWHFDENNVVDSLEAIRGKNAKYCYSDADTISFKIRELVDEKTEWKDEDEQIVLITGGEPSDFNLVPLVRGLHSHGFDVHLETSGTAFGHFSADIQHITVSPKFNNPNNKLVMTPVIESCDELKVVIGKEDDIEELDRVLSFLTMPHNFFISLQPMSQSKKATEICVREAIKRNWNVSLQTHKYLEIE